MQPFDKIQEYGKTVCDQIRWKKAHPIVVEEIENHMIDQRDAYILEGEDELTATNKAISQMGDPETVGVLLDRTHRPKPQYDMIGLTALLVCMGLFIRIFLMPEVHVAMISKQIIAACIGFGFMCLAYFADFTLIGKYPGATYISILVMSCLTLFLSPKVNGQAYYAQYAPLLFPVALVSVLYWARNKRYLGMLFCGGAFAIFGVLTLMIPSASSFIFLSVTMLIILEMAVRKNWFDIKKAYGHILLMVPTLLIFLFGILSLLSKPYIMQRLRVAINPALDPQGAGYLAYVIRSLLGNSKFIGPGVMPEQFIGGRFPLPEYNTDYLLTYLIFNVGWISFFFILALFIAFFVLGFMKCFKQKSGLGLFVSTAVMLTFTIQSIGYIIANLGFQLFAPAQLPLVSYGNISMVINLTLIGFMLSAFRSGDVVKDECSKSPIEKKRISLQNGVLTISFKR